MEIEVNAIISPETLINAAVEAGLSDQAINYFRHFQDVPLKLFVNAENGAVYGCIILIDF